jgi:hypothetical protein
MDCRLLDDHLYFLMPWTATMKQTVDELVRFLQDFEKKSPGCTKAEIELATQRHFGLLKKRSLYTCDHFVVRFSTANTGSFSNVVLSLSAIQPFDHLPFIVCVVRPTGIDLLLANTTFLKKISHSSHELRLNNVKGSFLGHDIIRDYEGISNAPANFPNLCSIHAQYSWSDNLRRLVEATKNICPTGSWFEPTDDQTEKILQAPKLAHSLSGHKEYKAIETQLSKDVRYKASTILEAARIDNINERGNFIEQILTEGTNIHGLDDLKFSLAVGATVLVDVKTKLLSLSSSPKAYNVDKVLRMLADGETVFSFFFIGIDIEGKSLHTRLVSIFDKSILAATRIQFHWAGRNSRGVTQLSGDLSGLFSNSFHESIDVSSARSFLQQLIEIRPKE